MRKLFISYPRENRRDVDQLVEQLELMGYTTWVDSEVRGGQDWWAEVLRRIADSDVFIAIISPAALTSTACRRESEWAEALARPVLPVAVEPTSAALPGRFARRQIIDYSRPEQRDRAALMLQGGLGSVSAPPPLPDPLPEPPAVPMSYLTDLVDLVTQPNLMDHAQQHQILQQLEAALRSVDPEERRGGQDILERLASRTEIYADVDRTIGALRQLADETSRVGPREAAEKPASPPVNVATDEGAQLPGQTVPERNHPDSEVESTRDESATGLSAAGQSTDPDKFVKWARKMSKATPQQSSPNVAASERRGVDSEPAPSRSAALRPTEQLPKDAYTPWITRVGAWIIDTFPLFIVITAVYTVTDSVFGKPTTSGSCGPDAYCTPELTSLGNFVLIVGWLLVLACAIWNYGYRQGTTGSSIGKAVLKFKAVDEKTGQPIGFWRSILRLFAQAMSGMFCYIGHLFPLWDAKRQTLGDKVVSTVCVPI